MRAASSVRHAGEIFQRPTSAFVAGHGADNALDVVSNGLRRLRGGQWRRVKVRLRAHFRSDAARPRAGIGGGPRALVIDGSLANDYVAGLPLPVRAAGADIAHAGAREEGTAASVVVPRRRSCFFQPGNPPMIGSRMKLRILLALAAAGLLAALPPALNDA
jgi:hypothetical protein